MRTIKFRGKRLDNEKWVYGDLIHGQGSKYGKTYILPQCHIYPKGCSELDGWNVYPETVGQFTGLLDKNGVEIYEGDIVKWDDQSNGKYWRFAVVQIDPDIQFNYALIVRVEGVANSYNSIMRLGCFAYRDTHNWLQVIGNIHDNSERLK